MEKNVYTILIIDPHSSTLLSNLKTSGTHEGFEFYATDSVAEGLVFLKSYAATLNAILLGIKFPKEPNPNPVVLHTIKREHPDIPVILLTERNSTQEIELVSELMKIGAYNYVAKKGLNQAFLFQVITAAIQHQQLQLQWLSKSYPTERKTPFFIVRNECSLGRFQKKASFGFDLVSVNKPSDEQDEQQKRSTAIDWHENLLKSISFIYRDELQINLKFIARHGKLRCCIIFSVFATDDTALELVLKNIQHDTSVFFSGLRPDGSNPYIFERILDKEFLSSVQSYQSEYQYNLFYRKPLKVKKGNSIGFNSEIRNVASEKNEKYLPNEIFPVPMEFDNDNEIFRALHNQNEYTEIDVLLIPKLLLVEEIDLIRRIINNPSIIEAHSFSSEEIQVYISFLKKFIVTPNDKFMVSVLLKTKEKSSSQHLTTGIKNYFFGSHTEVSYQLRKSDRLFRFSKSDSGRLNQLPFFYSIHEVLQVFRLPLPGLIDLPGIKEQSGVFHYVPDNLPTEGVQLGEKSGMNGKEAIRLNQNALARHLYIMGQTGTGKTTLLKTMIWDCLSKNEGVAVIDPHGDLFNDLIVTIPDSQKDKLVVIDTANPSQSARHNPISFDPGNPASKSLVINELLRIFSNMYNMKEVGGPTFELFFKNGLLLIMDEVNQKWLSQPILTDFVELFYNEYFREKVIAKCENRKVVNFFRNAHQMSGDYSFNNFAPYITSKLVRFTEDYYLTPIIADRKSKSIDYRNLIDEGKILLVKLDKGLIGVDNVVLLGQMVLSSIILAAMSRSQLEKEKRKPFYLFIDEFQNFIRSDVGSALSEVRKFGLSLTLANQTLGQLNESTVEALLGNVGSMVFFRPGIRDYEIIKNYVEPEFKREDVLKLPNFNCIARLLVNHIPSDPFVFQTKY